MGGNALKHYETTRLSRVDYFSLVDKFSRQFGKVFGEIVLIKSYKNKETFGDADFLVDSDILPNNWTKLLKSEFNLDENQYVKNGNVVSIGYENFQIDLIVTPHEEMKSSEFYFSYNDFGNLIGRIGHKLGVKIGHRGMSLVVRHRARSDHILREIKISDDYRDVLNLLGLNLHQYEVGFDDLEDIFEYVASSKYFDPEIYSMEHRSANSRVRDKKRATYSSFLRWVDEYKPKANHEFKDKSELGGYSIRLPYYETEVLSRWPHVKNEVDSVISDFELDLKFKEIYNGDVVSKLTGYTGKTLGAFMQQIKPKINKTLWIERPSTMQHVVAQTWADLGGTKFNVE